MSIFVGPLTLRYRRLNPGIRFDYLSAEQRVDLIRGEADVAFRAGGVLEGDTLIRVALPDISWTAYCAAGYGAGSGMPADLAGLTCHPCIGYAGPIGQIPQIRGFMQALHGCDVVGTSNSVPNMTGMIRAGVGIGLLPCMVGDMQPDLRRCFSPPAAMKTPWWIVVGPEAWALPRVRGFVGYAAETLRQLRPALGGEIDQHAAREMLQDLAGSDG